MAFPKVYFFADDQYWRYDIDADAVEPGWPKEIKREWRRLEDHITGDAVNTENGKAYFFYGKKYRRFDMGVDRVDVGPLVTADYWHGVPDLYIDAVVRIGNGDLCFFHGNTCSRYNLKKDHTLDGYPKRIADDWPGMPDGSINAALNYGNGSIYFFKDQRYTRFELAQGKVTQGFQRITDQWHRMPDKRIDAALEWSDSDLRAACVPIYDPYFWNDDRDILVNNNCYNYGCNRFLPGFSNPGRGSGHEAPEPFTNDGLDAAVRSDGLVPIDPDNPACTGCRHVIMMFRWEDGGDFHFYHRNTDGLWSHKVGHDPVSNLDHSNKRITDPRTADTRPYTVYCGTYCVDRSVLRIR